MLLRLRVALVAFTLYFPAAQAIASGAASLLEVRDANGNPLPGGYLSEEDTAYSLTLRTTQAGLDSITVSATTAAGVDTETLILRDTVHFRDQVIYSLRVAFSISAAAADGKSQAAAFDTLQVRWVNPSDTSEVALRKVPVRHARRAARAWFSSRADGGDTINHYPGSAAALHLAVMDQVLPTGAAPKAIFLTRPVIAGAAADTESVNLAPVSGKPGLLLAALTIQATGTAATGDGTLRLDAGDQAAVVYFDPVDGDSAAAYAGLGVPPSDLDGDLQFIDANGNVLPKGFIYSPAQGRVHLRFTDDWAAGSFATKGVRMVVQDPKGFAPSDTETVTLALVPALRNGAMGHWQGSMALRDFGAVTPGDQIATLSILGRLVATVTGHKADASAAGEAVDTLLSAMPEQTPKVRIEDSRSPTLPVGSGTLAFVVKAEGAGRSTAVDTLEVRIRCVQSGDSLVVRLVEDAALSGAFASQPVPLARGPARADDSLSCLEKDVLRAWLFGVAGEAVAEVVLDGSMALRPHSAREALRFYREGSFLRSGALAGPRPVAILVFNARGNRVGSASAQEAPGTWRLPPVSGPIVLEVRWGDGTRKRAFHR